MLPGRQIRLDRRDHLRRRIRLAEVVEQERSAQDGRRGVGELLAGDVRRRTVHGLEHAGEGAVRVDVAGCRQSDAAADRSRQVGEDVAEQVVGDDHIESSRVGHQEDGRRIHVQVADVDVRELGGDTVDGALPEAAGVHEHVGLVHERQLLAAPLRQLEREAGDPLDAERGVDGELVRDLVRGADAQYAPPLPT